MIVIPFLDPKKKIQQMGDKFYTFRFMLTLFISVLITYILYASKEGSLKDPNMLIAIIGALFAMLGNYFQTILMPVATSIPFLRYCKVKQRLREK